MSAPFFASWFVAVFLVVLGASHLLRPREWNELFSELLLERYAGLVVGTLTLPYGLAILLAHPGWSLGPPSIVTLVGWGWTVKGALYMLQPSLIQRVATRHLAHPSRMQLAGGGAVLLGGIVLVDLLALRLA